MSSVDPAYAEKEQRIREIIEAVVAAPPQLTPQDPPPQLAVPAVPALTCGECGARFSRQSSLKRHERKASCFYRERKADERQRAKQGPAAVVAKPPPTTGAYPCERCGDCFNSKRALIKHLKLYRCFWQKRQAAKRAAKAKLDASSAEGKPYACDRCGRRYASNKARKKHMRHGRCLGFAYAPSAKEERKVAKALQAARAMQPASRTLDASATRSLPNAEAEAAERERAPVDAPVAATPPTASRGSKPMQLWLELINDEALVLEDDVSPDGKPAAPASGT